MTILQKLQLKSKNVRTIIFWFIIISLAIVLFFLWFKTTNQKVENFQMERKIENIEQ